MHRLLTTGRAIYCSTLDLMITNTMRSVTFDPSNTTATPPRAFTQVHTHAHADTQMRTTSAEIQQRSKAKLIQPGRQPEEGAMQEQGFVLIGATV